MAQFDRLKAAKKLERLYGEMKDAGVSHATCGMLWGAALALRQEVHEKANEAPVKEPDVAI